MDRVLHLLDDRVGRMGRHPEHVAKNMIDQNKVAKYNVRLLSRGICFSSAFPDLGDVVR